MKKICLTVCLLTSFGLLVYEHRKASLFANEEKKPPVGEEQCVSILKSIQVTKERVKWEEIAFLYQKLGKCYASNGQTENAVSAYKKALYFPHESFPIFLRLQISEYLGDHGHHEEALKEISIVLSLDSEHDFAHQLMARYSERELEPPLPIAVAREEISEQLADPPSKPPEKNETQAIFNAINKAKELALKKCYKQAYSILDAILGQHPCHIQAHLAVANVLSWEGRFIEALMQVDYVLYLDPRNLEAKLTKATVLRWKKVFARSALVYKEILNDEPASFYTQLGLAYVHVARNNLARVNQIMRKMRPENDNQKKEFDTLNKYTIHGTAFDSIFYRYQDNQGLETKKYIASATDWVCDSQITWIYRHVDAIEPTNDSLIVKERLESGFFDILKFPTDCLDIGGGIGYAKISRNSRGNFVIGNVRANLYTDKGNFSVGSLYDVYVETAAALFFKIRTWTNYIGYTNTVSSKFSFGGHYIYTKYSDANHSNGADLFALFRAGEKTLQIFLNYAISYLNFASQPISFFTPSIISGGHGYFDPKNALNNQVSLPLYYDRLEKLYFHFIPYVGYLTYHLLGIHYNGIYYIGNGLVGYRFSDKLLAEAVGEAGVYDLKHLHYTYSIVTGRLRLVF